MPIEVRELVIRASVESQRDNTTADNTSSNSDAGPDRQLSELMKIKKLIEQKNER